MFPICFPAEFQEDILPVPLELGVKEDVYRIIKEGEISSAGFLSSYQEWMDGTVPFPDFVDPTDPGIYATSCQLKLTDAKKVLKLMMRHYPRPIIAKGFPFVENGPSQLTREREERRKDSHVDWWIFQDGEPEEDFKEVRC